MTQHTNLPIRLNRKRLLERFLRYVRVETTADPQAECYPSSDGQRELGKILRDEMNAIGLSDVEQDANGLVWGTVPPTTPHDVAAVALVAHLDTSPEAPGAKVDPQVIETYRGGDIPLPSGQVISVEETAELKDLHGCTLITTDGTTLLGGDDKAGVAIIMELAETLIENPDLPHGPVRLLMTCDEEIGHGTDKIDLQKLNATVAYTLDGGGSGVLDVETFSADAATVTFTGHNIHPAIAKGRMVSALRAACDFVAALPRHHSTPETTDGREGFIHPCVIEGGVGQAKIELILRSFDAEDLKGYADLVRRTADDVVNNTTGLQVKIDVRRQYRNLKAGLQQLPQAVSLAEEAMQTLGREITKAIIRGGTDGSQLTEKGLPTPNLSSGQYNIHSVTEFACLDDMVIAGEHLIELLRRWSEQPR